MRVVSTAAHATATDDSDARPITPRGMAAPPAPRKPAEAEGDSSRPATIRIEASGRTDSHRRRDLERELDRLQTAAPPRPASPGRHLKWLLLSQGLLLNAFVILLVFGWSAPLPGRRLLLGGIALSGAVLVVLIDVALRGTRESRRAAAHSGLGHLAARVLPATFVAGWIGLSLYVLALPPSAKAFEEARVAPAAAPAAVAVPVRAPMRTVATQAAVPAVEAAATNDSQPPQAGKRTPFKW